MNAQTKGLRGQTAIRSEEPGALPPVEELDPRGWLVSLQWKTLHILHVGQQSSGSNTAGEGWGGGRLVWNGSGNYFTRVAPVHCQERIIVMSRHSSGNFSSKDINFPLLTTQPR